MQIMGYRPISWIDMSAANDLYKLKAQLRKEGGEDILYKKEKSQQPSNNERDKKDESQKEDLT